MSDLEDLVLINNLDEGTNETEFLHVSNVVNNFINRGEKKLDDSVKKNRDSRPESFKGKSSAPALISEPMIFR